MKPQLAKVTTDITLFTMDPFWAMEEKFDGDRMLIAYTDNTVRAYSRTGTECVVPSQIKAVQKNKGLTILDGELMKDGSFKVFDIPSFMGISFGGQSLIHRRSILQAAMAKWDQGEKVSLVYQARTIEEKLALQTKIVDSDGEGFMFKRLDSKYRFDYRTPDWLKFKLYKTASVVVTELQRDGKPEAIGIGVYDNDNLIEVSGCKLPYCHQEGIDVGDVIEVKYLQFTDDNRLREPVFIKKRNDVYANECTKNKL